MEVKLRPIRPDVEVNVNSRAIVVGANRRDAPLERGINFATTGQKHCYEYAFALTGHGLRTNVYLEGCPGREQIAPSGRGLYILLMALIADGADRRDFAS